MRLSERVNAIQPSPTMALNARAGQMQAQGIDVVNLTVGQPDFPTPKHVCEAAIKAIEEGFTRYTPAAGIPELKQAIVEKFARQGLEYTTEQVMVNVGGKHSGYLVMQALVDPGDEVIVPAPYWVSYPPMVILAGGKPVILPTSQDNGFKLTPQQLEEAITPRTKAVIINSPSNPTGAVYSPEELKPLVEICINRGVVIVSDEIYETIVFDGLEFTPTPALAQEVYDSTVVLNGVSKAYAMTGWRIGYMAGPAELVAACAKIQSQSTSNPTSIAQKAAVAALTGPQDEVERMRASFEARREVVMELLGQIPDVTCFRPQGAFYAFPDVSAYFGRKSPEGKEITGSTALAEYLLDNAHVAVVPGAAFGEDRCIRLSFATSEAQIREGLKRIAGALGQLK